MRPLANRQGLRERRGKELPKHPGGLLGIGSARPYTKPAPDQDTSATPRRPPRSIAVSHLEREGLSLAHPDAQRGKPATAAAYPKAVHERRDDARPACA